MQEGIIATFLKDIFSDDDGNLAIDAFETGLIGISFVCFGLTLLTSVIAMWFFRDYEADAREVRAPKGSLLCLRSRVYFGLRFGYRHFRMGRLE